VPRRRVEEPDEVERAIEDLFEGERRRLARGVRARRKALGWSQDRLAEEARLSTVYVSHLELARGNVNPTLRALTALACALGCEVKDLGVIPESSAALPGPP
jgi:transcriptional regulator with XRE-family HTH domain